MKALRVLRREWRDLVFWCAASGAFLTVFLMTFVVRDLVVRILMEGVL